MSLFGKDAAAVVKDSAFSNDRSIIADSLMSRPSPPAKGGSAGQDDACTPAAEVSAESRAHRTQGPTLIPSHA